MKFCPNCHREVRLPVWLKKSNVKSESGNITMMCGYCKKGKVKIEVRGT